MASPLRTQSVPNQRTWTFDERQWVIQIRRTLEQELEDETDHPVSIFNVSNALMSANPDLYTPRQVAIGPYHCWRPELYEMERHKLAAAKRIQKYHLQGVKLQDVVRKLDRLEHKIRACYHKYLDFSGETLTWMMAIDASFLLQVLQIYTIREGKVLSRMSHLVDYAGRKSSHNAILRDIVMLENQIPLFVLRNMLAFQLRSTESADEMLFSMLLGLCRELSPFKMAEVLPKAQVSDSAHVLDFLYHIVVPQPESDQPNEIIENESEEPDIKNTSSNQHHLLKRLFLPRSLKFLTKLMPWRVLCNFPGISILKQHVEYMFFSESKEINPNPESEHQNKPPLVEEIAIPSVTELLEIGVRFSASNSNLMISCMEFDPKTATFYLPAISLDINSEVILRNIVAYEAANASGPLIFTRYTELMNGIIDTEEDAKALRDHGVILNRLKSDAEVAELWNGMSKSIRLTKVPFLDKAIEDVNHYYSGRWKVKIGKVLNVYVFGSWQFLTFLATIMLLFLMTLQAFCTIYSCARVFRIKTTSFLNFWMKKNPDTILASTLILSNK